MSKINFVIKYNKTDEQLKRLLLKKPTIDVIYNIQYNINNRRELNIIKSITDIPFINNLFEPCINLGPRIIQVEHSTQLHRYLSFAPSFVFQFDNSKIIIEIPIEGNKKYILILSEQAYSNLERLYFISFYDGSVYYPIYHSQTFDYLRYQNVKNDDKLLGFYKPSPANLPQPLCWKCKYYSHEPTFLGCAVNPATNTNYCFDCKDYVEDCSDQVLSFDNDPNNNLRFNYESSYEGSELVGRDYHYV
jgi:hypothetical protein